MNENFKHIEDKLTHAGEHLALSISEKDAGRERVAAFLEANPSRVASPHAKLLLAGFRPVFALFLILTVGVGAASASEDALPGSILYPIKVRVIEPTRVAFAQTPEDRADVEMDHANRRLEEFARLSVQEGSDETLTATLAVALKEHVDSANEAIDEVAASGDETGAFDAAADLHSILEAHTEIFDRLEEIDRNGEQEDSTFGRALDSALSDTESRRASFEKELNDVPEIVELETALYEQESDVDELVEALQKEIKEELTSLDGEDEGIVSSELAKVAALLLEADAAKTEGRFSAALLLLSDANENLNKLKILLEADAHLGIDIIETDTEGEKE